MPEARLPALTPHQRSFLESELGAVPNARTNDGVVPSLSQVFGEIVHAVTADHLDVVGHFENPAHDPPHYDWLRTGSGFRQSAFHALWRDVAHFMVAG